MVKKYFYITILAFLFSFSAHAQDSKQASVEGLNFYPNPVSNGKIYLTSKSSIDKEITIFDVLGKKVFQKVLNTSELNIANLSPGVYIIKIKENEATATRKLIIK